MKSWTMDRLWSSWSLAKYFSIWLLLDTGGENLNQKNLLKRKSKQKKTPIRSFQIKNLQKITTKIALLITNKNSEWKNKLRIQQKRHLKVSTNKKKYVRRLQIQILFYMNKIPPCSVPPPPPHFFSRFFASIKNANRFWNNGQILTFKVSKQPYRSLIHDRIICKWRQCLLVGQKWN